MRRRALAVLVFVLVLAVPSRCYGRRMHGPELERVALDVERDMRAWRDVTRGDVQERLVLEGVEPEEAWHAAAAVLELARERVRAG